MSLLVIKVDDLKVKIALFCQRMKIAENPPSGDLLLGVALFWLSDTNICECKIGTSWVRYSTGLLNPYEFGVLLC